MSDNQSNGSTANNGHHPGRNGKGIIRRHNRVPFRKASYESINERVEQIANYMGPKPLITEGELKKYIKKQYNLQYRQALTYIARARALLRKRANMPSSQMKVMGVNVLIPLLNSNNERIRICAEQRLSEIGGYNSPHVSHLTTPPGQPFATEVTEAKVVITMPDNGRGRTPILLPAKATNGTNGNGNGTSNDTH